MKRKGDLWTNEQPVGRRSRARVFVQALDLLLPVTCVACGQPAAGAGRPIALCRRCHGRLLRWPATACAACGRALGEVPRAIGYRCGTCRRHPPPFTGVHAVWRYASPIDAVIRALKFGRLDFLGPALGRLAAAHLAAELPATGLVVPVPLHFTRRWRRGYDQAQLIARGLAQAAGLRSVRALRRRGRTRPQSRLPRATRLINPADAFVPRAPPWQCRIAGREVVLVDDVVTTGATVRAAAHCLLRSGALRVQVVAVARAM